MIVNNSTVNVTTLEIGLLGFLGGDNPSEFAASGGMDLWTTSCSRFCPTLRR